MSSLDPLDAHPGEVYGWGARIAHLTETRSHPGHPAQGWRVRPGPRLSRVGEQLTGQGDRGEQPTRRARTEPDGDVLPRRETAHRVETPPDAVGWWFLLGHDLTGDLQIEVTHPRPDIGDRHRIAVVGVPL